MEKLDVSGENTFENGEVIRSPEDFFEKLLHTATIVGSGKDGIVLKIDLSNFDASTIKMIQDSGIEISAEEGYALKILKIYHLGSGESEYNMQKAAYELLKDAEGVAKIPKPIIMRVQHLSESDRQYLKKYNHSLESDAEIILMDYIDGKDLATIIYDFILSRHGYDDHVLQNMDFEQKQEIISNLVNFEIPNNATPGDFRDVIAKRDNVRKLMSCLRKYNFHIDENVLEQIKKALDILESNRIFHNDLHERNIMINENGVPFIIDFGRTVDNKDKQSSDDSAIIRRFEVLNKNEAIEDESKYWRELADRISKSEKWIPVLKKWGDYITNNKQDIIFNSILSASANERHFEQFLGALAHLFSVIDDEFKQEVLKIVGELYLSVKTEYMKRKVNNLKNYIEMKV